MLDVLSRVFSCINGQDRMEYAFFIVAKTGTPICKIVVVLISSSTLEAPRELLQVLIARVFLRSVHSLRAEVQASVFQSSLGPCHSGCGLRIHGIVWEL